MPQADTEKPPLLRYSTKTGVIKVGRITVEVGKEGCAAIAYLTRYPNTGIGQSEIDKAVEGVRPSASRILCKALDQNGLGSLIERDPGFSRTELYLTLRAQVKPVDDLKPKGSKRLQGVKDIIKPQKPAPTTVEPALNQPCPFIPDDEGIETAYEIGKRFARERLNKARRDAQQQLCLIILNRADKPTEIWNRLENDPMTFLRNSSAVDYSTSELAGTKSVAQIRRYAVNLILAQLDCLDSLRAENKEPEAGPEQRIFGMYKKLLKERFTLEVIKGKVMAHFQKALDDNTQKQIIEFDPLEPTAKQLAALEQEATKALTQVIKPEDIILSV